MKSKTFTNFIKCIMSSTTSSHPPANTITLWTTFCLTLYLMAYVGSISAVLYDPGKSSSLLHFLFLDRAQDFIQWIEPLRLCGRLEPDEGDSSGGRGVIP